MTAQNNGVLLLPWQHLGQFSVIFCDFQAGVDIDNRATSHFKEIDSAARTVTLCSMQKVTFLHTRDLLCNQA